MKYVKKEVHYWRCVYEDPKTGGEEFMYDVVCLFVEDNGTVHSFEGHGFTSHLEVFYYRARNEELSHLEYHNEEEYQQQYRHKNWTLIAAVPTDLVFDNKQQVLIAANT